MQVSKECIIKGVSNYVNSEVIGVIGNNNLKFLISTAIAALEVNPRLADKFFDNMIVKVALVEEDGKYDIEYAEQILTKTAHDCNEIKIEIPSIPLMLPDAQELTFRASDVEKLFKCIRNYGGVVVR